VKEYDIYLSSSHDDGTSIDSSTLSDIKAELASAFGGYTHLCSTIEGVWRLGRVTFRDQVTILRILDDGTASFDLSSFKKRLEKDLHQQEILIVAREVTTV